MYFRLNCAIIFVGILPDSLIRLLILIRTESFYGYLEEKFGEPWSWDSGNGKPRAQAIYTSFTSITRFEKLIAFSILFNGLEPLKLLVIKCSSDIYEAYQMIDKVITNIKYLRENIDHEFDH